MKDEKPFAPSAVSDAISVFDAKTDLPEPLLPFRRLLLDAEAQDADLQNAIRRIDEASASLLRPNGKGGAIYEYEKKLSALEKELDDSERTAARLESLSDEFCRYEREKAKANAELDKLLDLENAYGNLSLIREYDELHTLENALDSEKEAYENFLASHRVGTFLPTEAYGEELSCHFLAVSSAVREYAAARSTFKALDVHKEQDAGYEEHLRAVHCKYGGFNAVRRASRVLAHRASHTAFFSLLALFTSAFFFVCTLLSHTKNVHLSIVLASLAVCALASAPVLLLGRRRFRNALLILCREFGAKDRAALYERLRFLEEESTKEALQEAECARAKKRLDLATHECTEALERLNSVSAQWGRRISPTHASEDLEKLLSDVKTFLQEDLAYRSRIEEKTHAVTLARKALSASSEIAVRALVSPSKRENLRLLEKENRLPEIAQGIALYRRTAERLEKQLAALQSEREELERRIITPDALRLERDVLAARVHELRALHTAYTLLRQAFCERLEKKTVACPPRTSRAENQSEENHPVY